MKNIEKNGDRDPKNDKKEGNPYVPPISNEYLIKQRKVEEEERDKADEELLKQLGEDGSEFVDVDALSEEKKGQVESTRGQKLSVISNDIGILLNKNNSENTRTAAINDIKDMFTLDATIDYMCPGKSRLNLSVEEFCMEIINWNILESWLSSTDILNIFLSSRRVWSRKLLKRSSLTPNGDIYSYVAKLSKMVIYKPTPGYSFSSIGDVWETNKVWTK